MFLRFGGRSSMAPARPVPPCHPQRCLALPAGSAPVSPRLLCAAMACAAMAYTALHGPGIAQGRCRHGHTRRTLPPASAPSALMSLRRAGAVLKTRGDAAAQARVLLRCGYLPVPLTHMPERTAGGVLFGGRTVRCATSRRFGARFP